MTTRLSLRVATRLYRALGEFRRVSPECRIQLVQFFLFTASAGDVTVHQATVVLGTSHTTAMRNLQALSGG